MKKLLFLFTIFTFVLSADEDTFNFSTDSIEDISVFYVTPKIINKDTRLVVVMHGRKRNGEEYRDQWIDHAKELNLVVVVPEFSEATFSGVHSYNYGNVFNAEGQKQPKESRLFSIMEPLVKESLKKFKIRSDHWGIYGHGAGAHFVHRYVLYNPQSSHTLAIAANLGWYLTMTDKKWPFGLKNSDITDAMLKDSFDRYFLLMLGMSDVSTKPNTEYVASIFDKVTDQGKHRLERGRNFFNGVLKKSNELDTFLKWGLVEVPTKDGHSNTKQMVPFAAELLYERLK
jgi:hypothetical protein